jgi:ClpP class serine protease
MSEETPSVEEIKARLKIEVEEEPVKATANADISNELKNLGRQFAETLQSAWNSEERQRIEKEVREGVKSFIGEVDRVFQDANSSAAAERIRNEAANVKTKVDSSDIGKKAQSSLAQGLKWMSEELNRLADKFTAPEKPEDEA